MSEFLFQYQKVNPTTWVYLSSLLMIGLYFKFGRFWSVRNLDLMLLILLAPGLLMAQFGGEQKRLAWMESQRVKPDTVDASGGSLAEASPESQPDPSRPQPEADPRPAKTVAAGASLAVRPTPPTGGAAGAPTEPASTEPLSPSPPVEDRLERSLEIERLGYLWLFAVGTLWLVRLLLDATMVRRPLLEPNLSAGGLTFIGCSLFVFLMANVIISPPTKPEPAGAPVVEPMVRGETPADSSRHAPRGPGYALLNLIPSIPTMPLVPEAVPPAPRSFSYAIIAKAITILCHLAIVVGIAAIGYWHFGNIKTGVGMATLYLMLPYTAQMTGCTDHVIPAALLIWAVLCYRRPLTAGLFIGLATSLVYYPAFLLPLWVSFYWRRGLMRFSGGVVAMLVVMAISLAFTPEASYWQNLKQMFGLWLPVRKDLEGIWGLGWDPVYRYPVLAAFVALSGTFAVWPAQKNLGTLLSCSAAVMVATQFWHGYGGGLYMAWYLPLTLLTMFRPNLEDRVALAVLGVGWGVRRAANVPNGFKAA
jgi:hypothetical protein